MSTEERAPFEIRSANWYEQPLDYELVIYEPHHETHVATITMNRPEKRNALSHRLRGEIFHALKVAERDNEINVIVLKGAGPCFSSGYDFGGGMGTEEPDFSVPSMSEAVTGPAIWSTSTGRSGSFPKSSLPRHTATCWRVLQNCVSCVTSWSPPPIASSATRR